MAAEPQGNVVLPATAMFQKAHGRIVMLQRIDEQLAVLLDQRRKVQEELRLVQQQINEEFERVIKQAASPSPFSFITTSNP